VQRIILLLFQQFSAVTQKLGHASSIFTAVHDQQPGISLAATPYTARPVIAHVSSAAAAAAAAAAAVATAATNAPAATSSRCNSSHQSKPSSKGL
jgi:hypothetical protein